MEGYFRQLEELLQRKPLFEQFREAFRWYHSIYLAPSLLLDEVSPSPAFQGFPEPRDSRQFDALERVITRGETPSDINFAQLKSGLSESVNTSNSPQCVPVLVASLSFLRPIMIPEEAYS